MSFGYFFLPPINGGNEGKPSWYNGTCLIRTFLKATKFYFARKWGAKVNHHVIKRIEPGSIAEEIDLHVGDELISMNGVIIEDVLDYKYYEKDEELELVVFRPSINEEWDIFIEKEDFEELGLEFDEGLMDEYKSCHNKCVFCFIDQLPPNMRETMYFKDDDARLSFLQGNYITMTNMKDKDFNRIISYRLSPMNLSIHTMNMELRKEMLHNRYADNLIGYMDRLYESNLYMNGQIVLCKGINDKEELDYSIKEMMKYLPFLQSVSIVPVGLSKYRDHLTKLEPFTKEDAGEVIALVEAFQKKALEEHDCHFIHAADEFYFLAEQAMPSNETYDGYLQYENGVGMTRLLIDEFEQCYNSYDRLNTEVPKYKKITVLTGKLIESTIKALSEKAQELAPVQTNVIGIVNRFFGERITVSGLVTGIDIIEHLHSVDLGDIVYLPRNMLKSDEEILLDNVTLKQLEIELKCRVMPLPIKGDVLFEAMLGKEIKNE
jgi:putative radical SAM enzyme (TIGR03279 family)